MDNMGYYKDLEQAILSAGLETLVRIKEEVNERLRGQAGQVARKSENPTVEWDLYLETLCNTRLLELSENWGHKLSVADDLDFLGAWYDCVATVARSVNRRQADGHGGCNAGKMQALLAFYAEHEREINDCGRQDGSYGQYLYSLTREMIGMNNTKEWHAVEKVETIGSRFRPSRMFS